MGELVDQVEARAASRGWKVERSVEPLLHPRGWVIYVLNVMDVHVRRYADWVMRRPAGDDDAVFEGLARNVLGGAS